MPSDPDSLVAHLRELPGSAAAVGLMSQWLHKGLVAAGFETVLMETRRVKSALKSAPVKADPWDAEGFEYVAFRIMLRWLVRVRPCCGIMRICAT